MQKARLVLAWLLPALSPALLPPSITVRRLDSTSTSEWCAAAAVRAAAFLDDNADKAALLRKIRRVSALMRTRESSGSEFLVATTTPKARTHNDDNEASIFVTASAALDTSTATTGDEAVASDPGSKVEYDARSSASPLGEPGKLSGFSKLLASALEPFKQRERGPRGDPVMAKRLTTLLGDDASNGGGTCSNLSPAELLDLLSTSDDGDLVVGMVDLSRSELLLPSHQLDPSGAYVCALSPVGSQKVLVAVMMVSPNYRRLGVGRRLMEFAETLALKQGGRSLTSSTVVAAATDRNSAETLGEGTQMVRNGDDEGSKAENIDEFDGECPLFGFDAPPVSEFWLHVEASEPGAPARKLYEGLGYQSLSDDERRYKQFTAALNLGPGSGAPVNKLMRKELLVARE